MGYEFLKNGTNTRLTHKSLIIRLLDNLIKKEKRNKGRIVFVFCDDVYLRKLNKRYLQHDYNTDIITFDYSENKTISGEIYISVDTVSTNSEHFKTTFYNELHRVIIHGVLHLCGYNDHTAKEKILMRQKEDYYLSLMAKIA